MKFLVMLGLIVALSSCATSDYDVNEEDGEVAEEISDDVADSDFEESAEDSEVAEKTTEEAKPEADLSSKKASNDIVTVTNIDYLSNTNGGIIQISTTGKPQFQGRFNSTTSQYVIEISDAKLPDSLKRPFIMKEFESMFGAVNAYQNPGSQTARIVVQMRTNQEPVTQVEGNKIIILPSSQASAQASADGAAQVSTGTKEAGFQPVATNEDEKILGAKSLDEFLSGSVRFYGTPISIETSDADIREVIKFISDEKGVNLVLAEDVQGKISLKLRDVPWDQALVIVMRTKGLGYVRQGSVLRITKLENLQAEAKAAKDIIDSQSKLTPLRVKVIPISYANPSDMIAQITPFLTDGRGRIVADERTSALIVTDTVEVLGRVERLIKELDIPPAQVMIEGKIVEASENFSKSLGVDWQFGDTTVLSESGGRDGSPVFLNLRGSQPVNIQSGSSSLGISFGRIDFFGNLQATLGLAESEQLLKIISSPKIVTMNRVKAEISQKGQVVSFRSQAVQGQLNETVVGRDPIFRDVILSLIVTPQITAEGSVIMDIQVKREFPGPDAGDGQRAINTREAKTKVLVANGQTAVIGGIYQSDESESETGTPGLKNLPVFGWLFKSKTNDKTKNELLVFLTPRILNAKEQGVVE